jgi:flagellar biosynthesis protein FliR
MESVYQFSEPQIVAFALALIRLSAFVVTWPIFGIDTVPAIVKILFSLVLTLLVFSTLDWSQVQDNFDSGQLIWMAVREAFIGLAFGFLARMFFVAIQVGGELISMSIGFSGAQLFNPAMGGQITALDQFFYILAGLFFLTINGHHLFLTGIVDTFRVIPLGPSLLNPISSAAMGDFVQQIMSVGLRISAPMMLSILVVNLVMGILGKTVPQVNVLITSLAVNILVGIFVLIISLPVFLEEMPDLLEASASRLFQIVRSL